MTTPLSLLTRLLLLDHIHHLIRHSQILDVVPADVAFRQSEEFVAVGRGLHDFFEGDVHVGVAGDEVAVEGLAGFEFDEHRVALSGGEEAEGKLTSMISGREEGGGGVGVGGVETGGGW
jgi:hypothetical protein